MVRVLSIVGYTRSGSTLLDSILGELDGVFSAGELHYLWERGLLEHRTCGCGDQTAQSAGGRSTGRRSPRTRT